MLRCASSFVVAAYVKVRLTPYGLRALPAELFYEAVEFGYFLDFLRVHQNCAPEKGIQTVRVPPFKKCIA